MPETHEKKQIADIDAKIKEANAYTNHGLYKESFRIYKSVLQFAENLDPETKESINERLRYLKSVIEDLDKDDAAEILTSQDVSVIKDGWTEKAQSAPEILDSGNAFKELGLYKEALMEYKKLFSLDDFPIKSIVPELAECFIEAYAVAEIITKFDELIQEHDLDEAKKNDFKFEFGQELVNRDKNDSAIDFFEAVKKSNPNYQGIDDKIKSLAGSRSFNSRYDYLLQYKVVDTGQLQSALSTSKTTKKSVEKVLMEQYEIPKDEIGKSLSFFYNCPFKQFSENMPVPYELIKNLKKPFLLQDLWVPLNWEIDHVEILIDDPKDIVKIDNVRAVIKTKKIIFAVGIKEDIIEIINLFFSDKKQESFDDDDDSNGIDNFDQMTDISFEEDEEEEISEDFDEASGQVVRFVDQTLVSAYRKGASDIHVEPSPITKKCLIRFRIDGVCQEFTQVPISIARGIISRLKIMASLDIAEKRLPQDGKIKFKRKGIRPFELRLATLPTPGGFEDAVLRILAESGAMKIDEMGIADRTLNILKRIIQIPYGLILVVGPTGSGKTTTLHSALGHINRPGIKIWTAEDPIEITQYGLRQVEAKPKIGLDFARIMRAFLRADPDVIMIGEMRDHETASIGIEASLTGHLVLSTLHTNSAPETITRLLDMGLNALNFSDAFLGVLAQRLVRRLCKCKKEYNPTQEEFDDIVTVYGAEYFSRTGIEYSSDLTLFKPKGCEECSGTGYRGRCGIHEMLEGTPEIKKMIKRQANTEDLFKQGISEGMNTLSQDGIIKVFQGLTDMSEIKRVCL